MAALGRPKSIITHAAAETETNTLDESTWLAALESPSAYLSGSPRWPNSSHRVAFGVKAVRGHRPTMEDAYTAHPELFTWNTTWYGVSGSAVPCHRDKGLQGSGFRQRQQTEAVAFFGVYDGHGGDEVSEHCATRLHSNLLSAFASAVQRSQPPSPVDSHSSWSSHLDKALSSQSSDTALGDSSGSLTPTSDDVNNGWVHVSICTDSKDTGSQLQQPSRVQLKSSNPTSFSSSISAARYEHTEMFKAAFREAFLQTDIEIQGTEAGEYVGSTAVAVAVTSTDIFVANCGDSRAVLGKGGSAVSLTNEHKPDRKDEAARVEAAGGRVVYQGGSHRVMGLLAMSRAIGDHFLRPYVIADPEVAWIPRTPEDELLILASDGFWDVFTNEDATGLALRCLQRANNRGASPSAACRVAASVLSKAALERGSRDNITVLLVDLRPQATTSPMNFFKDVALSAAENGVTESQREQLATPERNSTSSSATQSADSVAPVLLRTISTEGAGSVTSVSLSHRRSTSCCVSEVALSNRPLSNSKSFVARQVSQHTWKTDDSHVGFWTPVGILMGPSSLGEREMEGWRAETAPGISSRAVFEPLPMEV